MLALRMSRPSDDAPALYRQALDMADGLYNLARRLTGADADADDLVQETYARAIAGLGGFERGTNLRAWMFRILRNAHIDAARRRKIDPTDRAAELPDVGAPDAPRDAIADVERAIAALPDAAREVVLLDLEGLSESEIASIVGAPVGTVKSRLSRARASLREALEAYRR
jgi:RNA polymerase sigma-70 factor (ECF subfamily)